MLYSSLLIFLKECIIMSTLLKTFLLPPGKSKTTSSKGQSPPQSSVKFPSQNLFSSWYCFDHWSLKHFSCFLVFDLAIVSSNCLPSSLPKQTVLIHSFNEEQYTHCVSGPAWGREDTIVNKTNTVPTLKEPRYRE